jgi:alpha-tubulin suppressor-like RCC1 family protein
MAFTQISTTNIKENTVVSYAEYAAFTANVLPKISSVQYADETFTALDDTAANTSGTARLVINGSGFQTGATVIVGTTSASSTARVSTEQLRANVTALSSGSYTLYVQNPDGGTAIRVNGATFSNTPVWSTAAALSNQEANTAFAVSISANSDSNVTYSNTTSLPAGTTLLANGLFYGTVTVGVETAFTFGVKATDVELQDETRTFSLTVTVGPPAGQLFAFGQNNRGQLGFNDTTYRSSPTQVGSSTNWISLNLIGPTGYSGFGIKSDNTLWSWGQNGHGQLGLDDTTYRSSPVQVGSATNWNLISSSTNYHVLLTKTNGTLWGMGRNTFGNLGLGNSTYKSSPTQVGTDTNWNNISQGTFRSAATKTDGTLWLWGRNNYGTLGLNDTTDRNSPTQVGTGTNWSKVAVTGADALATKTDGTLWAIGGSNDGGRLGLSEIPYSSPGAIFRSSPVQIGANTNWNLLVPAGESFAATKTDGTLWSWGPNINGQLGHNNSSYKSSPVQVGTNTNWSKIDGGSTSFGGIKTDGTLWLWGNNGQGQLGLNDRVNKSSPTQVGSGTTWVLVATARSTLAIRQ